MLLARATQEKPTLFARALSFRRRRTRFPKRLLASLVVLLPSPALSLPRAMMGASLRTRRL